MRAIDAEPLVEMCKSTMGKLAEWEKESGLDYSVIRRAYYIAMNLLYTADTLDVVTRQEYNRQIEEYEMLIRDLKDEVPIIHVGCDPAVLGYEK